MRQRQHQQSESTLPPHGQSPPPHYSVVAVMARKTAAALMNALALAVLAAMMPSISVVHATSHGAEDAKAPSRSFLTTFISATREHRRSLAGPHHTAAYVHLDCQPSHLCCSCGACGFVPETTQGIPPGIPHRFSSNRRERARGPAGRAATGASWCTWWAGPPPVLVTTPPQPKP